MTGEVTLRGRVLPIGGLREKTMAAYRYGVKTVIIPKRNLPDLYEVDPVVKNAVEFQPVSSAWEVLEIALVQPKNQNASASAPALFQPETKSSRLQEGGLA